MTPLAPDFGIRLPGFNSQPMHRDSRINPPNTDPFDNYRNPIRRHRKVCVQNCAKGGSTNRTFSARRLGDPASRCPTVSQSALVSIQPQ